MRMRAVVGFDYLFVYFPIWGFFAIIFVAYLRSGLERRGYY